MAIVHVPASSGWKVALDAVVPAAEGGGCLASKGTALPLGECAVTSMSWRRGAPEKNIEIGYLCDEPRFARTA